MKANEKPANYYRLEFSNGNMRKVDAAYANIDTESGVIYFMDKDMVIVFVAFREGLDGIQVF